MWVPVDIGEDMAVNIMTAEEFVRSFPEIFDPRDDAFVADLEFIHDSYDPEEWEKQLNTFAKHYNLKYNKPKDIKWQQQKTSSTRLRAS